MNEHESKEQPTVESATPVPPPRLPADTAVNLIGEDFQPLDKEINLLGVAEALLRHPGRIIYELQQKRSAKITGALGMVALLCLLAYGLTAGMFAWGVQIWAAPVKITLGMLFSGLICLPSLVIFSCLSGTKTDVRHVCALLVGMVALTSLLLLGFGPVSWVFSQSTESIGFMGALHIVFYAVGLYYGLRFLMGAVRFLEGRRVQHLVVWSIIFILVSLQMMTTLRPIIGTSDHILQKEKKFFLAHWTDSFGSSHAKEDTLLP